MKVTLEGRALNGARKIQRSEKLNVRFSRQLELALWSEVINAKGAVLQER